MRYQEDHLNTLSHKLASRAVGTLGSGMDEDVAQLTNYAQPEAPQRLLADKIYKYTDNSHTDCISMGHILNCNQINGIKNDHVKFKKFMMNYTKFV